MFIRWPFTVLQDEEGAGGGGGGGGGGGDDPGAGKTFTEAELQAAVAKEVAGLKANRDDALTRLEKLKPLRDAVGDLEPDAVRDALKLAGEIRDKKRRAEGDFDKWKGEVADKHKGELAAKDERIKLLEAELFHSLAAQKATEEIASLGGAPKVLLPHVVPHLKVTENEAATKPGERFQAVVVDAAGNPRIADGAGTPLSIKALIEEFRADDVFAANFSAGSSTGSGAGGDGPAGGNGKVHTLSAQDALDPAKYRAAKAAAETAGVELRVERS